MPSPPPCHDKEEAGGSGSNRDNNVQKQGNPSGPLSSPTSTSTNETEAISSMMMVAPVMARLTGLSRDGAQSGDGQIVCSGNSSTVATTRAMPGPNPMQCDDALPAREHLRTFSKIHIPPSRMKEGNNSNNSHVAEAEAEQIAPTRFNGGDAHDNQTPNMGQQSNAFSSSSSDRDQRVPTTSEDSGGGGQNHIIVNNSLALTSIHTSDTEDRHQNQVEAATDSSSTPVVNLSFSGAFPLRTVASTGPTVTQSSLSAPLPGATETTTCFNWDGSAAPTTLKTISDTVRSEGGLTSEFVATSIEAAVAAVASKSKEDKELPLLDPQDNDCTKLQDREFEVSVSSIQEDLNKQDDPSKAIQDSNMSVSKEEDEHVSTSADNDQSSQNGNVNDSKSKPKRKRNSSSKAGQSNGRWTQDEHQAFLEGLQHCGREWKKVAVRIPTRTSAQIRSHAQKYFAKLQRDEVELLNSAGSSGGLNPSNSMGGGDLPHSVTAVVAGDPGLLSTTIVTSQALAPSVQRNVERIIADPHAAQREVESTLEALRERYRQLQQRLEERRERRNSSSRRRGCNGRHVEPYDTDDTSSEHSSPALLPRPSPNVHHHNRLSHKSMYQENPTRLRNIHNVGGADENSSVSSNVSSVAVSRDLGNEEIIALQVLGGSLPRGDSSVEEENDNAHDLARADDNAPLHRQSMDVEVMSASASPSHPGPQLDHDCRELQQQPQHHQESKVSSDVSWDASMEDATDPPHQETDSPNKRKRHDN